MGVERFEVLLHDPGSGKTITRDWHKSELLKSVAWLKRMNARGNDVHIRPAGEHGLVLLDGLKAENLAAMRSKGFDPAVIVETSRGEFQAWVKLSEGPVAEQIRKLAAVGLTSAFHAALGSAEHDRYGRLAGFTRQDGAQTVTGRRPYALAYEGRGEVTATARAYVERIREKLKDILSEQERIKKIERQLQREKGRSRGR